MADAQPHTPDRVDTPVGPASHEPMTGLVSGILEDAHKLVRQQFEMLKAEIQEDLKNSKRAAEYGGLGVVLLTVGILGLVTAIAYFLHDEFHLAMWASWAITSGVFMIIGIALATSSYLLLERFSPIPRKTFHALQENLQWKTNK
jgi:uncharacterized membrane protein YqjE